MNILVVGGNFDHNGGSPSSIVEKIHTSFKNITRSTDSIELINGGNISNIRNIEFKNYDVLLWAPNISNDEEKIIPDIKTLNPRLTLISTKRVVEKSYTEGDIIGRLLKTKSNLGIMITKVEELYRFKLLDPLGNCYTDTSDIECLVETIFERLLFVNSLSRLGSVRVGDKRDFEIDNGFIEFVKHSASEFSTHVNAVNPNRLLGNASTRCTFGFPAEKQGDRIFVTQRNIDKELIESKGFVEVSSCEQRVEYYGDKKPSVDTPIQIRLFNFYNNVNYIVHGHVYIEGAPFTDSKIPCGFVEEFDEITKLYPNKEETIMAVNLRGHGCIILSNDVTGLWNAGKYISRDFPEF